MRSILDARFNLAVCFFIILPFLFFYWMIPFAADLSLGNDYYRYPIQNQMELLFSIKTGSFPLYAPGFDFGHSSSALTLGQVYHPISHIASIMPGYWEGNALQWNTFIRLISLGLAHLALFGFLRKLKLNILISFLLSCITVYNLRMLDLFRYGSSLEAYTGYLLLCSAIGWYIINPTRWRGPLAIIGATYLLVCSGHPQMMYYGLLGAGLFLLLVPFFVSAMLSGRDCDVKTVLGGWFRIGSFIGLGIMLSSAYILPYYFDFVAANITRVGQSYAWADGLRDTFIGTLNNFFIPLLSDVHGAFGGSSLILVVLFIPVLKYFRIKIPRIMWIICITLFILFLYMQGGRTPVHHLFWEYFPFASSFRIAGRITIMMPLLIMMLFAWIMSIEAVSIRVGGMSAMVSPARILAFTSLFVMTIYLSVITILFYFAPELSIIKLSIYTPVSIFYKSNQVPFPFWILIMMVVCGMTSLLLMAFYDAYSNSGKVIGIVMCLLMVLQIAIVLRYGNWVVKKQYQPTYEQMIEEKKVNLDYWYNPGSGLTSSVVETQVERSFMEPYLAKIYTQIVPVYDQNEAYGLMQKERSPGQIFVEGLEKNNEFTNMPQELHKGESRVELIYSSFNRLEFKVASPVAAFFSLSYPYSGHWTAWLNGNKTSIYRSNGAANAVRIPEGESLIKFLYFSPAAFWGMLISCITFALIGWYISFTALNGVKMIISIAVISVLGAGVFFLWHSSLYSGKDLNTKYFWTDSTAESLPNIAYGKKTWVNLPHWRPIFRSSRAVDGSRREDSGFETLFHDNPMWTIDLYRVESINKIIIYENASKRSSNIRPMIIDLSTDGNEWDTVATVTSKIDSHNPLVIDIKGGQTAQFVRIKVSKGYLALNEVEIYGTE